MATTFNSILENRIVSRWYRTRRDLSSCEAAELAYARRGGRYERSAYDRPALRPLGGGFRGVDHACLPVRGLLLGARRFRHVRMQTNGLVLTPRPDRIHLTEEVATPGCRPIAVPRVWRSGRAARSTPRAQSPPVPLLQAPRARRNRYLRQPNRRDSGSPAPASNPRPP
jgi:hypothetical protein